MNHQSIIFRFIAVCCILIIFNSCKQDSSTAENTPPSGEVYSGSDSTLIGVQRFKKISAEASGVQFSNQLKEDYVYNILYYEYIYNGGGVAIGDINNDGLPDLYFTASIVANKLYLNKGNMTFEDITESAGVASIGGFKTGVTMADVNSDGYLDIFVCQTSRIDDGKKNNLLFINNKNNTFTESAAQYNLVDNANTNHANFFDYDLDGDLDLYMLNHRLGFKDAANVRLRHNEFGQLVRLTTPFTPFESDRLYRNDGSKFTDVSIQAGINNSAFGLSATVGDINKDGYPDIFVANDFIEPDYVYINNRKGGFVDMYESYIRHGSQNSMGSDLADFNNDGLLDLVTLDMTPDNPVRYKQLMNIMRLERYETLLKHGYGHQVSRNVLQLNNGDGSFSEIAQFAGISNTDWSWSAFFADFDNDGYKDLFIDNGYKHDVTDMDYMTYNRDSIERSGGVNPERYPDINEFLNIIPSVKLRNYVFRNTNGLRFEDVSDEWGFSDVTFSNGAAYADLDRDGDLDIVVNNIDDIAFVYENLSNKLPNHNYLQLQLNGPDKNKLGIGTKVTLHMTDGSLQYQELTGNRGFYSSPEPLIHFGLPSQKTIDRVEVIWPDGKSEILTKVNKNQRLTVKYSNAKKQTIPEAEKSKPIFTVAKDANGLKYTHVENDFTDFLRERLIPHKLSQLGPSISMSDVNGDGLPDCYVGGATNSAGALFIQKTNSTFEQISESTWQEDKQYEDISSVFFDADGDKDKDLFVVSGGNTEAANSVVYQDRLYLNDGKGTFSRSTAIPKLHSSGGCVSAHDIDGDGDKDIIVGGRVTPGAFPVIPESYILRNDSGKFTNITKQLAPDFQRIGMVSDIIWVDVNQDGSEDMIVVGEWMPVTIFTLTDGKMTPKTIAESNGWWNCVVANDFDGDGDKDLVAGNLGGNTRLKASPDKPLRIYAKDFDKNGAIDPIMTFSKDGKDYPFAGRDDLAKQIPKVKKKFPRYYKYAVATIEDVFSVDELKDAQQLEANNLLSGYFENQGDGNFTYRVLPDEAQFAPCQSALTDDFNKDGHPDVLLVGNNHGADTETGIYDASNGTLLLGDGKGNFLFSKNQENGLWANKEARDVVRIPLANGNKLLVVANNNGVLQAYEYKR